MKTAIVTGVLGGIGNATARMLVEKGWFVAGMDVKSPEDAGAQLEGLEGNAFRYIKGNISDKSSREALVEAAMAAGELGALVNVAGVAPKVRADLLEMTEESYDFVMGINTKGTLFLTQLAANAMIRQGKGGFIVNISSCSAYTSSVNRGEYCISKAGVSMITKLFADRLAGDGIVVNEICPGIIATGMTATVKDKYDRLIEGGLVPLGRWGQPEDIARAVCALCDGTFGYTTGASFIVDGGIHIRKL
ncbi:MAG: 3-ketoacyl-ACP reductase [Clostridia bacterium]|nr:3-ketoacyl-ACP reductase [Clostridia bacterium]